MNNTEETLKYSFKCPACGSDVHRGRSGYGCSNYQNGCKFFIKEYIAGARLTYFQIERLALKGSTGDEPISGFKNKSGQPFKAVLLLDMTVENDIATHCDVKFHFPDPRGLQSHAAHDSTESFFCPACGGKIKTGKWGWECSNNCGFTLNYKISGREMTRQDLFELLMRGETRTFTNFVSKKGKPFAASIRLAEDKKRTEFVFAEENTNEKGAKPHERKYHY